MARAISVPWILPAVKQALGCPGGYGEGNGQDGDAGAAGGESQSESQSQGGWVRCLPAFDHQSARPLPSLPDLT